MAMPEWLADTLDWGGYLADSPGALLRGGIGNLADVLSGEDRQHGWRASTRDLLEQRFGAGPNEDDIDTADVFGFIGDMVLDPTNLIGAGLFGKGALAARAANKGIDAANLERAATNLAIETAPRGVKAEVPLRSLGGAVEAVPSGDRYFKPEELAYWSDQDGKSREILTHLSPEQFLRMAESLSAPVPEKLQRVREAIASGVALDDIPYLGFNLSPEGIARTVAHEGRHRAIALQELGIDSMPVRLRSQSGGGGNTIRWGSQDVPGGYDVLKGLWPERLLGESGGEIPFPVHDMRIKPPAAQREGSRVTRMPPLADFVRALQERQQGPSAARYLSALTTPNASRYLDDLAGLWSETAEDE